MEWASGPPADDAKVSRNSASPPADPSRPGEDRGPCPGPEAEGTDLRSSGGSQVPAPGGGMTGANQGPAIAVTLARPKSRGSPAGPRRLIEAVTPADRMWMRKGRRFRGGGP